MIVDKVSRTWPYIIARTKSHNVEKKTSWRNVTCVLGSSDLEMPSLGSRLSCDLRLPLIPSLPRLILNLCLYLALRLSAHLPGICSQDCIFPRGLFPTNV